jgi:hypothetical protein
MEISLLDMYHQRGCVKLGITCNLEKLAMTRSYFVRIIQLIFCFSLATTATAEAPKATAQLLLEAGKASPQGKLRDYLKPANAYHLNIFGGAKVDVKYIGAVGLGWDFTYSDHALKGDAAGHYRRFTWDWFHLPLSLGFFYFKPGLSWVLTNVKIPELGIDESSIRPELLMDVGVRVGLGSNFGLTAGGRGEWAWLDTERTSAGKDLAITGNVLSWFAGVLFVY